MNSILAEFGFPSRFPKRVLNEVELIKEPNYAIESKKRKDFRAKTTFTIDPHDAKDFDDAISIAFLASGNMEISRGKAAGFYDKQLQSIHLHKHENVSQEELDKRVAEALKHYQPIIEADAEIVTDELSSLPKDEESLSDPQT